MKDKEGIKSEAIKSMGEYLAIVTEENISLKKQLESLTKEVRDCTDRWLSAVTARNDLQERVDELKKKVVDLEARTALTLESTEEESEGK